MGLMSVFYQQTEDASRGLVCRVRGDVPEAPSDIKCLVYLVVRGHRLCLFCGGEVLPSFPVGAIRPF